MYPWLLWGEQHGSRDEDLDVLEELLDMRTFYGMMLPEADNAGALNLVNDWIAKTPNGAAAKLDSSLLSV